MPRTFAPTLEAVVVTNRAHGGEQAAAELGFITADKPFMVHVTKVGTTFPGERFVASVSF